MLPPGVTVDLFYVLDGEDPEHLFAMGRVIEEFGGESVVAIPRPPESTYATGGHTHRWDEATFDHVGRNKDRLIDKALSEHYTHVLFVDSDLILEPTTIYSMLRTPADLVSACFWTQWNRGDANSVGPNVWLRHPYGQAGLGMREFEFWRRLATRRITHIAGGGACMLMNRKAIEQAELRYFPRIQNLPDHGMYRGEDRSFCIKAKRLHLSHAVDPWPDIFHAYHAEQRSPEVVETLAAELADEDRKVSPEYGDLVNFVVTPLEEPEMVHDWLPVRGRLGQVEVLPEIEAALLEMVPGEQRIVNLKFPMYWSQNPGQQRMVQLELVDTKPWGFAPVYEDHVFRGLEAPGDAL